MTAGGMESSRRLPSTSDWWRPTRTLATWLSALLVLQALAQFTAPLLRDQAHQLAQWHLALDALLDGRNHEAERIYRHANHGFSAWSLISLATTVALVILIMWMWRSVHNARALGRTGARLSPGWSIGAWFIPVANFVLVYLVYSDLWRSTDPDTGRGDGWRALPGSALVRAFWALYVVGTSMTFVVLPLAISGTTDESTTRALLLVGAAVNAAASLVNIVVIRDITSRQEAVQARDPAATEPFASPTRTRPPRVIPDAPGWYADPSDHFDHRYWDGTLWTEHVSRGGVVDTAPVVPPDWYPDPTGRFQWRYWTGDEWTEHTSRAGDLFVDPLDGDPPRSPPDAS